MKTFKALDFTPQCKTVPDWGKWSAFQAIESHDAGPAVAIDGKSYYFPASTMWEHVPGVPWFNTEREAQEVVIELRKVYAEPTTAQEFCRLHGDPTNEEESY